MRAIGWAVIDVFDGDTSVEDIVAALSLAKSTKGQPTMINIRTTIWYGTSTAGTFKSHHGTYTEEDAGRYATEGSSTHTLSKRAKKHFQWGTDEGVRLESSWNDAVSRYGEAFPGELEKLKSRMEGHYEFEGLLQNIKVPREIQATRQFNGIVFNQLVANIPNMMAEMERIMTTSMAMAKTLIRDRRGRWTRFRRMSGRNMLGDELLRLKEAV